VREFFIADLHLGHERLITGWNNDGQGPRKQFLDAEAMGRHIIARWNAAVTPEDRVYVLGDIALKEPALKLLDEMHGQKRAVLGNHDHSRAGIYTRHFARIYGAKVMPGGFVLTHIPIHPNSLDRKSMQVNIHGHLHEAVVTRPSGRAECPDYEDPEDWGATVEPDPRYVCVSCEQVGYQPISFDEIKARVEPFLKPFQPRNEPGTSLTSASDHKPTGGLPFLDLGLGKIYTYNREEPA
jgi:calcineurin-like phosphoesterase family protein